MSRLVKFKDGLNPGILLLGVLVLAVGWQHFACAGIFGVKPNLILAVVVLAALVMEPVWYFTVLFLASIGIEFGAGVGILSLGLFISGLIIYWVRYKVLADGIVAVILLVLLGTYIFYIVVDYKFIISDFGVVLTEFLYNLIISGVGFGAYRFLINEEE